MNIIQQTLFDYQQLDTETRIVVQQRTTEIKALMRRTAQDIIEIGQKLIEVKAALNHGQFGPWLEAEFEWGTAQAARFMQVADKFGGSQIYQIDKLAPSALYLLAAPSTPDEARQEAIDRARNGESVTHSLAKEIVNGHKGASQPANNGYSPADNQQEFDYDSHLDAALADEGKIVCQECGQVYDGPRCPDCNPYNYLRDNRKGTVSDIYTPLGMDACQTPAYAIDPLLPYIPRNWTIWEPAAGEGNLVDALFDSGFNSVVASDILTNQNFFDFEPDNWDCIVTNPPYSIHFQWLERCYELGQPFALLLKVEILGTKTAQELFDKHGIEVIFVSPRINFKMPNKGWEGGGAQFPTAWFTYGLNIGRQMTFAKVKANGSSD